ncbi:MAG: hypothetical protein IKN17_05595 [Ruminococcus sp.]|nr:hypothetical protein [Ruminococcus sp.]
MTVGELWWTQITNSRNLVCDITNMLILGRSVMVCFPDDIPWKEVFQETLENSLQSDNRTFDIHNVTRSDEPGQYLFKRYISPNVRNNMRYDQSYENFLAQEKTTVLKTSYVCVEGLSTEKCTAAWTESVNRYLGEFGEDDEHGIFLLLCKGAAPRSAGELTVIDYRDYISDYDCLMLCLTVVSGLRCCAEEKQYIAEFANALSRGSCELAGVLAEKGRALIETPEDTVREVCEENGLSFAELSDRIAPALWESQTKLVFPTVERFRKYFSDEYRVSLLGCLPFRDHSSGERINNVNGLEIGHLHFLSKQRGIGSEADRKMLDLMRKARNDSAHWDIVSLDDFREIIAWKEPNR